MYVFVQMVVPIKPPISRSGRRSICGKYYFNGFCMVKCIFSTFGYSNNKLHEESNSNSSSRDVAFVVSCVPRRLLRASFNDVTASDGCSIGGIVHTFGTAGVKWRRSHSRITIGPTPRIDTRHGNVARIGICLCPGTARGAACQSAAIDIPSALCNR